MTWHVYMIRCTDDSLYTGVTTDVARRFEEHRSGGALSARYVRGRRPLTLVYARACGSRSAAMKEEWRIKQLSKADKEALVAGSLPGNRDGRPISGRRVADLPERRA